MARLNRDVSTELPKAVSEIGKISINGNIIPPLWFKTITFESGKPDTNSILILSDICIGTAQRRFVMNELEIPLVIKRNSKKTYYDALMLILKYNLASLKSSVRSACAALKI